MNEIFTQLIPMDQKQEEAAMEVATKLADDMAELEMQQLDDLISGFWLAKPSERVKVYEAGEPLFVAPDFDLAMMLEMGDWGPMTTVMAPPEPFVDPMTGEPAVDPMTMQPVMVQQPLGEAPIVLGEYWRRMWAVDRNECLKMMRDYASILKEQERRLLAQMDAMPPQGYEGMA
jgi:hypothetical protein